MTETNNNSPTGPITTTIPVSPDLQAGTAIANTLNQESSLDSDQNTFLAEAHEFDNKHTTNGLVARMLWGHNEKASLNVRVSEYAEPDLNDDLR